MVSEWALVLVSEWVLALGLLWVVMLGLGWVVVSWAVMSMEWVVVLDLRVWVAVLDFGLAGVW